MSPLEHAIRESIAKDGPMPVAAFMRAANSDSVHGYYPTRDPLGRGGDFITAPEISQVFGELIGAWCAAAWQTIGAPGPVSLVELGPGRGTLMADMLRATAKAGAFRAAAHVHLVETSPALRQRQSEALAGADVNWHETFEAVPEGAILIVANEFFDALPIEQYVLAQDVWHLRCIDIDPASGDLRFVAGPPAADGMVPSAIAARGECGEGDIWETCPEGRAIMQALASRIARFGGAALVVDYGHVRSARGETLQAVAGHRYADVLAAPGEADLSAHVDFEALADAARAEGAAVHGPVAQGVFLERIGLRARLARLLAAAAPGQADGIVAGCRRLVDPDQMGNLFKVLAVTHPSSPVPAGFENETVELASC